MNKLKATACAIRNLFKHRELRLFLFTALIVAGTGLWMSKKAGYDLDIQMRRDLVRNAGQIARAVDPLLLDELTFSSADLNRPAYQRLSSQFRAYAGQIGAASLYTMAQRDGEIVFGPESLRPEHPYASPPGTVYLEPSDEDFEIFQTGRPQIQGPFTDEYGSFVSATAPVFDPRTGTVLAVIGIDVEASDWRAAIRRAQWIPARITLGLLGVLLLIATVLAHGRRAPAARRTPMVTVSVAVFLLLLTAAGAVYFHSVEAASRRGIFLRLAEAHAEAYAEQIRDIGTSLEHLAVFFETSEEVRPEEFRLYCSSMIRQEGVAGCVWIPEIPAEEKEAFIQQIRSGENPSFALWEMDGAGSPADVSPRPFFYPAQYIEPLTGHEKGVGFDLGSEPVRRAAIEEALRTGLETATDPVALFALDGQPTGLFVFRPVQHPVRGLVAFVLRSDALLAPVLHARGSAQDLNICLQMLESEKPPTLLARSSDRRGPVCLEEDRPSGRLREIYPVFSFGKTCMLSAAPSEKWLALHPLRSGRLAAAAGLLITLLVSLLVYQNENRQRTLERLVVRRTAELKAGEQLLKGILDTIPARVFWKDRNLTFLGCNRAFARDAGFENPDDLTGKDDTQTGWCERADRYRADDRQVIESGVPRMLIEEPQTTPDGQTVTLLTSKIPLRDAQGKICGVLGTYMDITERKRAEERIRDLVQHLETIREEERKRISRELHDDIGQILTALKIDLALLQDQCSCTHEEIRRRMSDMQSLLSEGIHSAHSLCRRLRPGSLDDLSLADAVRGLVSDWQQRNRVECEPAIDLNEEGLSDAVKTAVFRLVQEALTNISNYAGASWVGINLASDEHTLVVSVSDNGCGMEPGAVEKPDSFGLLGMRERFDALGGALHIESSPGKGTRIEAEIPLR